MCTITYKKPKLRIAKKDIIVYKYIRIVYKKFLWWKKVRIYSECTRHEYKKGVVYETELDPFESKMNGKIFVSHRGFYSFKELPSLMIVNSKFMIPEGSKYYLSKDYRSGCLIYTSNKIKLIDYEL